MWERENKTVEAKGAGAPPTSAPVSVAKLVTVDNGEFDVVQITDALVLQRLQLSSLPAQVRVRTLEFLQEAEDDAELDEVEDEPDAKRRRVDMYSATLEAVELDSAYPSGFSAHISYRGSTYVVDSDILIPDEAKCEKVIEAINELPPFEWDNLPNVSTRRVAETVLDQVFMPTFESVRNVTVEQYGDQHVLPYKLRVKAERDFKQNELVFSPFSLHATAESVLHSSQLLTNKEKES